MKYYLPMAMLQEFLVNKEYLGINDVLMDRNYNSSNQPQLNVPALFLKIASQKQQYLSSNLYRTTGYLHICVLIPDFDINWSDSKENYTIEQQSNLYTIPDRIENLLFKNIWKSEEMNYIARNNNCNIFPKGYNRSYEYNEINGNLVSFDMSVFYNFYDNIQDSEPTTICGISEIITIKST